MGKLRKYTKELDSLCKELEGQLPADVVEMISRYQKKIGSRPFKQRLRNILNFFEISN